MNTETISSSLPSLPASSIEILPDPIRGWLARKEIKNPQTLASGRLRTSNALLSTAMRISFCWEEAPAV